MDKMSRNLKLTKSLHWLGISNKRVKNERRVYRRKSILRIFLLLARATAGCNAKHEMSFSSLLKKKIKPE